MFKSHRRYKSFPTLNWVSLHTAFHYHPSIIFICLKYFENDIQLHHPSSWQARALDTREYFMKIEEWFFLFLTQTICCDPSSEPSRRDGSDEGSHHMLWLRRFRWWDVVTHHPNRLVETVQMRGHIICFRRNGSDDGSQHICFWAELTKIIPNYHQMLPLIYTTGKPAIWRCSQTLNNGDFN